MSGVNLLILGTKLFVQGAGVIPNEFPVLVQITTNWLSVDIQDQGIRCSIFCYLDVRMRE